MMRKTIVKLLYDYKITQTDLSKKMRCVPSNLQQYLAGTKKMTENFYRRCLVSMQQIADDREIASVKLKMTLGKLLMDMRNSDSIGDV